MLGFRLPIGASSKNIRAILPNELTKDVKNTLDALASMADKESKIFSQILAKMLIDKLTLEQVAMLAGVVLEKRYKEHVNNNIALVFRNSEYFAFQLMHALLTRVGYPFDKSLSMLESIGDAAGIPMTPRQRTPRSARSEEESQSDLSLSSSVSSTSISSTASSASMASLIRKLNELAPPLEVVTSLLPLYLAYLENRKSEPAEKIREGFKGQFLFSFFITPLQSETGSVLDKDDGLVHTSKINVMLHSLQKTKKEVLRALIKSLDEVAKTHEKKYIPEDVLTTLVATYETAFALFKNKLEKPLRNVKTLIDIYRQISYEAQSDECKEHYSRNITELEGKLFDFESAILSLIKQSRTLKTSEIEAKIATFIESTSSLMSNVDVSIEELTPLQRLVTKRPAQQHMKDKLIRQIQFLIHLGANLQATTRAYERSTKEVLQDVFSSVARLNVVTSLRNVATNPAINTVELARRKGLPEIVELLEVDQSYVITLDAPKNQEGSEQDVSNLTVDEIQAMFGHCQDQDGSLDLEKMKNPPRPPSFSLKQTERVNARGIQRSHDKESFNVALKRTATDNPEARAAIRRIGRAVR